jgi:hypothetical protein
MRATSLYTALWCIVAGWATAFALVAFSQLPGRDTPFSVSQVQDAQERVPAGNPLLAAARTQSRPAVEVLARRSGRLRTVGTGVASAAVPPRAIPPLSTWYHELPDGARAHRQDQLSLAARAGLLSLPPPAFVPVIEEAVA